MVAKSSELAVWKLLKKNLKTLMATENVIFKSQVQNMSFTLIMSLLMTLMTPSMPVTRTVPTGLHKLITRLKTPVLFMTILF